MTGICVVGLTGVLPFSDVGMSHVRADDLVVTNIGHFQIPFDVPSDPGTKPAGFAVLYGSQDGGIRWDQLQSVPAGQRYFMFAAPRDGKYGFAIRMTDPFGQVEAPSGNTLPELEVLVDTVAPELKLELLESSPGEVVVNWVCTDSGVVPESLRIEYSDGGTGRWKSLSVAPSPRGHATISAGHGSVMAVRATILDVAGNKGSVSSQCILRGNALKTDTIRTEPPADGAATPTKTSGGLSQPGSSRQNTGNSSPARPLGASPFTASPVRPASNTNDSSDANPATPRTATMAPPAVSPTQAAASPARTAVSPVHPQQPVHPHTAHTAQAANPAVPNQARQMTSVGRMDSKPDFPTLSGQATATYESPVFQSGQFPNETPQSSGVNAAGIVVPGIPAEGVSGPIPIHASNVTATPPRVAEYPAQAIPPQVQLVNSRVFDVEYQVDDVGPSGVSAVELFITENGGQQWYRYGNDPDLRSPFQIDAQGEGTFGFAVRIRNGLGLVDPPPQPGQPPEIIVVVDETPPRIELGQPVVRTHGNGSLDIAWRITDTQSSAASVRLEYSTGPNGPWTPVFDWQPDQGGYSWPMRSGMPPAMYFRLLARDSAGNVSAAQTPQAVIVDLKKPVGRLLRVQTVSQGTPRY